MDSDRSGRHNSRGRRHCSKVNLKRKRAEELGIEEGGEKLELRLEGKREEAMLERAPEEAII